MRKKATILTLPVLLAFAALTLLCACASQQQRAERRAELKRMVDDAIGSRRLKIEVTSMTTLRYGSRTVTPDFFLELHGDTLHSYLPYLGQLHQAPMMSPSIGLNFEAQIESCVETQPKKNMTRLKIGVRSREEPYTYTIELYDTGEASINVHSNYRDAISFYGGITSD
jgi:hypothetical protein